MRIGIDIDNTLLFYDEAFLAEALQRGLVPYDFSGTKQQLRDHVRKGEGGETEWQKLQGYVYGRGIAGARLFEGVREFFTAAQADEVHIVSHKTEFGHYDESKTNLREAATAFLRAQGISGKTYFADTRCAKVDILVQLRPDWFIDDLVEVFEEPHFPRGVQKILFHTAITPAPVGDWRVCKHWDEITKVILA